MSDRDEDPAAAERRVREDEEAELRRLTNQNTCTRLCVCPVVVDTGVSSFVLGHHVGAGRARWRLVGPSGIYCSTPSDPRAGRCCVHILAHPHPSRLERPTDQQQTARPGLSRRLLELPPQVCVARLSEAQYPWLGKAAGLKKKGRHGVDGKQGLNIQDGRADGKSNLR